MNAATGEGQRVSQVKGDRLCTVCGFNLIGQTVLREPVYSMLIVRCPECGSAAGVEEYPALGRWANRWAALLAGVWMLVVVAAVVGTTGMAAGLAVGAAETMGFGAATYIAREYEAHVKATPDAVRPAPQTWMASIGGGVGANSWIEVSWWESQDGSRVLRSAGGWGAVIGRETVGVWVLSVLAAGVVGMVWSLVLLGLRKRRVALLMLAPVVVAGGIGWLVQYGPGGGVPNYSGYCQARHAAESIVAPVGFTMTLALLPLGLCGGAAAGRAVVRWMVSALLPPRTAAALSFFWIAEGLSPPRPDYATTARSSSQKESAARATDLGQAGSKASKA